MIPSAARGGDASQRARFVTADQAYLGAEDGIEFWRGIDSAAEGRQAFLARALCAPGTHIPPMRNRPPRRSAGWNGSLRSSRQA